MPSGIDFNNFNYSDLIPARTIAVVQMRIRFCDDGIDGVLKPTKDRTAQFLDAEYAVISGPYAKRKFYGNVLVQGETDGQKQMVDRNMALLKAIIDSAKFLDPADKSPATSEKRKMEFRDFDGLRFLAVIGIEHGKDGYPDKNILARVVTRDRAEWGGQPPIDQDAPGSRPPPPPTAAPAAPVAPFPKPNWGH